MSQRVKAPLSLKNLRELMNKDVQRFRFDVLGWGRPEKMGVYAFFVDGILIDTGHSRAQKQAQELIKLPVEQIFITHHHEDHAGNLRAIQEYLKCPSYAHPLCAEIMKSPPEVCFIERKTWGSNNAVDNIIPIEDEIKTANHNFQIIHTPGHSDDHVCLYEPNEGWLFSGDLYVHHYIRYFMGSESVTEQMESIKKVLKLDFDRIFCSHNPKETEGKANFQRKLQFLEDFYGNVVQLHEQGLSPSRIMKQLKLKESWFVRLTSSGWLSGVNMVKSVIRDEERRILM